MKNRERMNIVKFLIRTVSVILLSFCFYSAGEAAQVDGSATAQGGMFAEAVARVNDQPISGRDLETIIRRELVGMGNPEWRDLRTEYRNELIYSGVTSLINSRLLYEKAVQLGTKATAEEVDAGVQDFAKNYSSDAEMNAALARQFLDRASMKQKLEQDLTTAKYLNSFAQTISVTPEEISKFYAENPEMFAHPDLVRVSHILLLSEESPDLDAQVKERAEGLLARAKKGEDFAKLAKENSVDNTASEGGDIGYATKDVLESSFADAVFSMAKDEIRIIKSRYGYHVIKLTDKKPEGVAALDEIREDLANILKQQKTQAELAKLINELQEQAKIEILISPGE